MKSSKMKNRKINFTKAAILALPLTDKPELYYDSKVRFLAVRVSPTGARTFVYYRRTDDGPIRRSIGSFPETGIEAARQKAERWNSNPDMLAKRGRTSNTITGKTALGTVWELWAKSAAVRKRSFKGDEYNWKKHLSHWKDRGIGKIRRVHVLELHESISIDSGRYMANRIVALLSTLFNFARMRYEYQGPNPCSLFFKMEGKGEEKRARRLEDDEVKPLFESIEKEPAFIQDVILTLLFTGARRGNVFSMEWSEINFDFESWSIPAAKSKNKRGYTVPLVPAMIDLLKRRKAESKSEYVFPSERRPEQPITEIRLAWDRIRERAKLPGFRLHDLRRSLASKLADRGASALVIDAILGHGGAEIVNVYARVGADPARKALEGAVHEILTLAGKIETEAQVIEIAK